MRSTAPKIAAVVVLYHPEAEPLSSLVAALMEQVGLVYLVDNSTSLSVDAEKLSKQSGRLRYLPNHANLGIATALNIAARRALQDGCELLLTMDQDSLPAPDMVARMLT